MSEKQQISEELLKRVDALAEKLGTTSEYLWGVWVKQGFAEGAYFLVLVAFGLIATSIGAVLLMRGVRVPLVKGELEHCSIMGRSVTRHEEFWPMTKIVLTSFGGGLIAAGLALTLSTLSGCRYLINPEFYAWEQVKALLGG